MRKVGLMIATITSLSILPLVHELLNLGFAFTLNHLAPVVLLPLNNYLPFSQVHVELFSQTLSQIEAEGIAVGGSFGEVLHQWWPYLFLEPTRLIPDSLISTIINPESSPLARLVMRSLTEVTLAWLGFLILRLGQYRSLCPSLVGLWLTLESFLAIWRLPLSGQTLEDIGLAFVVGPQITGNVGLYHFLVFAFSPTVVYLAILLLAFSPWILKPRPQKIELGLAAVLLLSLFPTYFGIIPQEEGPLRPRPAKVEAKLAAEKPTIAETTAPAALASPPAVKVSPPQIVGGGPNPLTATITPKADDQFQLLVDGKVATVRGVQYYFGPLTKQSDSEKEKILRRDLAIIRQAGFDTVMGWEEEGFDQRFLALAQEYDLKVIKPFLLKTNASTDYFWVDKNFLDPNLRATLKAEFREKIERNKNSPAILFWNIGADEPLERIHSYYRRDPRLIYDEGFKAQVDAQRQAAADLILELAVLAHQVDPRHPVIVSEPRYWHWPFYQEAVRKIRLTGVDPSNFLIYGANFYSEARWGAEFQRVKDETQAVNIAAAVTEWAPFGVDRNLRPYFRAKMSREIMKITPISVVYVFNPAADPLDGMPDPTQAIVSGLSLTDMERSDVNGLLSAIAETLDRPLFSTALVILQADRERGLNGVPLGSVLSQEDSGPSLYFAGTDAQGQKIAYRWRLWEKSNRLDGPEIVTEVPFLNQGSVTILGKTFLPTYLEQGGPAFFGRPLGNAYETVFNGQRVFRQDFSQGQSLVIPVP